MGVVFNGAVTTTYVSKIGSRNQAQYMIKVTADAAGTSFLSFGVQGSNDPYCDTATSTVAHEVNKQHINWFPATNFLTNKVHPTAGLNASSTYFG